MAANFLSIAQRSHSETHYDAVLVGAGIMSATLAALLHELDPGLRLLVVERLSSPGLESSSALNNAGTGHAANCELNYTPIQSDGRVATEKAFSINEAFERSLEFWASLTERGKLSPRRFLNPLPHFSFVFGEEDVAFLHQRYEQLHQIPAFEKMQWSTDRAEICEWMPLVMEERKVKQSVAATRIARGTDIDFGALTYDLFQPLLKDGAVEINLSTEVISLQRKGHQLWNLELKGTSKSRTVQTPFVFLGAGGGALTLLQRSGVPEADLYAGFPVSGQWLICSNQELAERHFGKVYGRAKVGAVPMAVPHLDTRWIEGSRSLLFGPYAGFSTKFLKQGSSFDLFRSVRKTNLLPMLQVGVKNVDLVQYLISQLMQSNEDRFNALKEFFPNAQLKDWRLSIAGQRVQIIKSTRKGGKLQMGTEVVSSSDGSLAALLGASPGASTAVMIMLEVLERCWGKRMSSLEWKERMDKLLPSLKKDLHSDPQQLHSTRRRNDDLLGLN